MLLSSVRFVKQEAQLILWNARAPHIYCALPELTKTHNYNLPVQSIHQILQLATLVSYSKWWKETTCKIWMPCVKYIPRYRPAYLKMVLRYTGERSEQYRSNLERMYKTLSTINCSNLVHLCLAVPEILGREN